MVFKGTRRRSAEDIAREIDSLGGMLDAFTSKEMVCFNTRILDEHLPKAFDILADLVREPRFATADIDREKSVVLEEIRMTQDNPEDLVHELFTQNFWHSHPLGRPILGTPETVSSLSRHATILVSAPLRARSPGNHCCRSPHALAAHRPGFRALRASRAHRQLN